MLYFHCKILARNGAGKNKENEVSTITTDKAMELATQIVAAAAGAGTLRLNGAPVHSEEAEKFGASDGRYIATLVRTIAEAIQS